jgi:Family of unknown function (DUF6174)
VVSTPRRAILVAASLVATGCGLAGPGEQDDFEAAKARWEANGPASYRITIQRLCYCGSVEPVQVTVSGGSVVDRRYVETGDPVPDQLVAFYPAVPGLFDLVADAYRRADDAHATYDPDWGFPTNVVIDYVKNAIDDELTVTTSDFQVPIAAR